MSGKESAPSPSSPHHTAKSTPEAPYTTPDQVPAIVSGRGAVPLVQRARLLQPIIGNRATQRLLSPQRSPRIREIAPALVQRQVLTKLIWSDAKTPTITDAIIGGRTPSPFSGTMGAHSTAWVAHIDLVRRMVVNLPLETACANLHTVAEDEMNNSPLLKLEVDKGQQGLIEGAIKTLTSDLADLKKFTDIYRQVIDPNPLLDKKDLPSLKDIGNILINQLRKTIDSYLTLVNYLPGATVADGDPGGHGEGAARNDINTFEYIYALWRRKGEYKKNTKLDGKAEESDLDNAVKGLGNKGIPKLIADANKVDFDLNKSGKLQTELMASLWTMFAAETPAVQSFGKNPKEVAGTWQAMLQNFLNVTRMAYPETFAFTQMHDPLQQQLGLDMALTQASNNKVYATILSGIKSSTVLGDVKVTPSTTRGIDQAPAVTSSDLGSASSGFQANVLTDEKGAVGDIVTTGRTPSPFSGTMGAHSTAWVAHLDAIRQTLSGLVVSEAIKTIAKKMEKSLTDPALELKALIDVEHHQYYLNEYGKLLKEYRSQVDTYTKDEEFKQVAHLERGIALYLTHLNFLPLSTIYEGKTDGRAEGRHRQYLINYEKNPEKSPSKETIDLLREHLFGLYDRENVPDAGHTIDEKGEVSSDQKLKVADKRFLDTMKEAYPNSYKDSGMSEELVGQLQSKSDQNDEYVFDEDEFNDEDEFEDDVKSKKRKTSGKTSKKSKKNKNNNNDSDSE